MRNAKAGVAGEAVVTGGADGDEARDAEEGEVAEVGAEGLARIAQGMTGAVTTRRARDDQGVGTTTNEILRGPIHEIQGTTAEVTGNLTCHEYVASTVTKMAIKQLIVTGPREIRTKLSFDI